MTIYNCNAIVIGFLILQPFATCLKSSEIKSWNASNYVVVGLLFTGGQMGPRVRVQTLLDFKTYLFKRVP